MTKSLREYVNDVMNDNRIFSYEDVLAMDNEEGKYYQKALDYQYGKIGFPNNAELAKSSDVVYVHEYTRQDGTVVRAHYRSKAGHGNPDKPVMQTPNEYKTTLEKEINDYMDRDVEKRYGAGVNKTDNVTEYLQGLIDILPETGYEETSETEYTPLYPSNGKLTGHVEISQDISNEMPVADIQPRIKLSAQAKPVSKPYTGREMNMSSVQLPEMERLGQLEDLHVHQAVHSWPSRKLTLSNEIMRRADRLKKEVDKSINQINESLNKIKLNSKSVVKNFITDKFLRGIDGPDNQRLIRYLPTLVVFNEYKNAFKYYRYALNNLQGADKDNLIFAVNNIVNKNTQNHILNLNKNVTKSTKVLAPKSNTDVVRKVKNNSALIDLIIKNQDKIKNGTLKNKSISELSFYSDEDLGVLIGEVHIYNPYIDEKGNLHLLIPDFYDFEKWDGDDFKTVINNNAFVQQERGEVTNYVLLLNIVYTKEELSKLRGWK